MAQSLRDLRLNRGLYQKAIADAVGVTVSAVSRWECGDGEPDPPMRPTLAKFFEITPEQLSEAIAESRRKSDTKEPVTAK